MNHRYHLAFLCVVGLFLSYPGHNMAARFEGAKSATRHFAAQSLFNLLERCEQLPATRVSHRVDLDDISATHRAAVAATVHLDLFRPIERSFQGERHITRYQWARILVSLSELLSLPVRTTDVAPVPFDVPLSHGARDDVTSVLERGIMNLEGSRFDGNALTSRYCVAQSLARICKQCALDTTASYPRLTDLASSHQARPAVLLCYEMGVFQSVASSEDTTEEIAAEESKVRTIDLDAVIKETRSAVLRVRSRSVDLIRRTQNIEVRLGLGDPSVPTFLHRIDEDASALIETLGRLQCELGTAIVSATHDLDTVSRQRSRVLFIALTRLLDSAHKARRRLRNIYARIIGLDDSTAPLAGKPSR